MVDTGLASAISFRFSEDKGRLIENAVYQHLKRSKADIYFHRGKKECDFIIKQGLEIVQSIQVTYSLQDSQTRTREIEGLIDAIKAYKTKNNLILTFDEIGSEKIEIDNEKVEITIKPVWQWMLE